MTFDEKIEKIKENLERKTYPIFISEGSSDQKLTKIKHNPYLNHCYKSLCGISGDIVVLGTYLKKNDNHILEALMENKVNIKVILSSPDYKVLELSGDTGAVLKKHKVNQNALLLVREGTIAYIETSRKLEASAGGCVEIPKGIVHEVSCTMPSKFFVIIPNET